MSMGRGKFSNNRGDGGGRKEKAPAEGLCVGSGRLRHEEKLSLRDALKQAPEQFAPKALCFRSSVLLRLRAGNPQPDLFQSIPETKFF